MASPPCLEWLLDATANLLHGKRRWPYLGPIPWTAIAASAAVLGYWLGGWRLAALAGGAFLWTALVGQWELAMQTHGGDRGRRTGRHAHRARPRHSRLEAPRLRARHSSRC